MICSRCRKRFSVDQATARMIPGESLLFCSEPCLFDHITGMRPLSLEELQGFGIFNADCTGHVKECHSPLLGVSFRSWFECLLAEHAVANWKTQIFYEPHTLPVNARHTYLPDFWLSAYGVWLEVKGEWRIGGKKKFVAAQRIIGADRLLLVPPSYRRWFSQRRRR